MRIRGYWEVGLGGKFTVGRKCAGIRGRLRGGRSVAREWKKSRHQYGLDLIISASFGTEYSSWH